MKRVRFSHRRGAMAVLPVLIAGCAVTDDGPGGRDATAIRACDDAAARSAVAERPFRPEGRLTVSDLGASTRVVRSAGAPSTFGMTGYGYVCDYDHARRQVTGFTSSGPLGSRDTLPPSP